MTESDTSVSTSVNESTGDISTSMAKSTRDMSATLPTSTTLATTLATTTSSVPALTTVLDVPSSCLTDYWLGFDTEMTSSSTFSSLSITYQILHLGPPQWDPSCFPSGYTPKTTDSAFYSPGLCPQSYIQACSIKLTAGTVTETQATCCPSGYLCQTDATFSWYRTNQCVSTLFPTSKFLLTSSMNGTTSSITTTVSNIQINAYGISIRYQPTDFVSASTTTSSPPSPLVPATFAPSNTTSSTPEADHSSGLSSGGGAGIGVGVCIVVFSLIGAGIFYFFRRRRTTPVTYEAASVAPTSPTPQAPAPPSESHDRSELVGSQVYTEYELDHIPREEIVSPVIVSPLQDPSHLDTVELKSDKE